MTSEPQPGVPEQPQPFGDRPLDPPGGCSRPLVVGCALVVVLAGLLLLGLLWKADDLMPALFRWSLEQFEQQVSGNLPQDLSEAERRRLGEAFDAAVAAVEEGTADPAALQRLQAVLLEMARADRLSRQQVEELTVALEAVAGERSSPATEPPPPAEGSTPEPLAA